MEFAGGAVRRPGKTGHQLADLEPVWQYMAPGGPPEIYYAYKILRYSGHQADDISGHTIGQRCAENIRSCRSVRGCPLGAIR